MSLLNAAAFVAIPFTFGGVFAHIMTFNAHRRLMALDALRQLRVQTVRISVFGAAGHDQQKELS
jgi:hypothetical protein